MKNIRLSIKLLGIFLGGLGILSCGDDDEGNSCITCTYPGMNSYTFCEDDPSVQSALNYYDYTWPEFRSYLKEAFEYLGYSCNP